MNAHKHRLRNLILEWQKMADDLARLNPSRSKGWIADQIAKEQISKGWLSKDIVTIHRKHSDSRKVWFWVLSKYVGTISGSVIVHFEANIPPITLALIGATPGG